MDTFEGLPSPLKKALIYSSAYFLIKPKYSSANFDISPYCNLDCRHCYYYHQKRPKSGLNDEEWIQFLKKFKSGHRGVYHANWIGGEPMLRKNLLQKCIKFFHFNTIFTNATFPLPNWRKNVFAASIDGTKRFHEKIRGKGNYDLSKKNILESDAKIILHMVINKINQTNIDDFLKEWSDTNVDGVAFSFVTNLKDLSLNNIFINNSQADRIVNKLLELKHEYGDFIFQSRAELELMKTKNKAKATGKNCLVINRTLSFDAFGKIKKSCFLGNMECRTCRCAAPIKLYATMNKLSFETIRLNAKSLAGI